MRRRWLAAAGLATVVAGAAGCAKPEDRGAMEQAVMAADRAFEEATLARGAVGWVSWFEADASQYHVRGVSVGTDAIRRAAERAFADTNGQLRWHPVRAVVAASGDIAWTQGRWESRARGANGTWAATGSGNYVTLWRRQPDGGWKVAVDIGNLDAPPDSSSH